MAAAKKGKPRKAKPRKRSVARPAASSKAEAKEAKKQAKLKAKEERRAAKDRKARVADLEREKKAKHEALRKRAQQELVHSSQLDERLRRGDVKATPKDKRLRLLFNFLNLVGFALILFILLSKIGIGPFLGIVEVTFIGGATLALLSGNSFLFNAIRWRALRGSSGAKVLDKAKSDLQLTMVSVIVLFTVVFIVAVELGAVAVFLGWIGMASPTVDAFASNFELVQVVVLLVYLLALIARETIATSYETTRNARIFATVATSVAGVLLVLGVLLATGLPQRVGLLAGVLDRQGIHLVTLGLGLDFLAMRIRMRLPSVWSLFKAAVDTAKRANPEMKEVLRKRARTTYIIAFLFVTVSMAFAGAIATGAVSFGAGSIGTSLAIFYAGTAVIILGLVAVRVFQSRTLEKKEVTDISDLDALVKQKRRSAEDTFKLAVYGVTGMIGAVFLLLAVLTGTDLLGLVPKKYATDLFLLALLFAAGPFGFFYNKELKRREAMDEKFPDFLRDIAESARAGMTLPRALVTAAGGTYGALTPEIEKMASQVEWGVEFGEALERFAERAKTPLIDRTVALVVEAQRSGGNVVDILTAASDDAREIKQIVSERNEQMKMYSVVVYIAFFVFIAVVLVLSAQFIPAFKEAVGAASGQQVGGLTFKDFDPEDFNTLFFHAAVVQAIGGGLVGGVLTRGNPIAGFSSIGIMIILAWLAFRVVIGVI